jgi:ABC-type multidrug transport system ATPase subunit
LLHALPEVQHVADRVGLIRNGSLVLVSTVDELRAHASTRIEVTFVEAPPRGAFEDSQASASWIEQEDGCGSRCAARPTGS